MSAPTEVILGWMNHLGYVYCPACALGAPPEREPDPSWEPIRRHNLASDADECDGCHGLLLSGGGR